MLICNAAVAGTVSAPLLYLVSPSQTNGNAASQTLQEAEAKADAGANKHPERRRQRLRSASCFI